jgi:ketosteroid isomerase-like protein
LANNYAVALEAIGATDTARQVLERALGDGAATAAAFRNLRSLYAKLAAASYARAVDAPVQRMTPTLALVMPSAKQALAFTPGIGEGSPVLARGQAPAPSIAPMAALGPEAPGTSANTPATGNRPPASSSTPAPAPVAQATVPASTATPSSSGPGATASSSAQPVGKPTPPPAATAATVPQNPASTSGSASSATGTSAGTAKPAEKPTDKPSDKAADKAADKASESTAEKPVNERQAAALAQLERATASWAASWSKKDVPAYLAFYAKTFQPPSGLSRSEWEKQRHDRLNRPGPIKVTIEELKVAPDGDGWRVTFRQHYRATGLESTATKSMRWVQEGGRWLIQAERAQ